MRYAELHYFADPRFVRDGFTLFLWATEDNQPFTPTLPETYGTVVVFDEGQPFPSTGSRYNPMTQEWADPLADDAVAALEPFHRAVWNHEVQQWEIGTLAA